MRLVGPGLARHRSCPAIGLNATLIGRHPAVTGRRACGRAGRRGGDGADRSGCPRPASASPAFASVGDKYDVSGNDMLMWWEQDVVTKLAVLCLESFGNPRKFARTARRVGATMPVLTVQPAEAGVSPASREALFAQAGIISFRDAGEMVEVAALLASQPVPAGGRVAVVSSTGAAIQRAAAACADAGLQVAALGAATQERLRRLLPPGADVTGPVNTTAAVVPSAFGQCLEAVAADQSVDALLALAGPAAIASLLPAARVADAGKPLVLASAGQREAVLLLALRPGGSAAVPAYGSPAGAARALAHAARHGARQARGLASCPNSATCAPTTRVR